MDNQEEYEDWKRQFANAGQIMSILHGVKPDGWEQHVYDIAYSQAKELTVKIRGYQRVNNLPPFSQDE